MEKKTDFSQVKNYTHVEYHPGSMNIEHIENFYYSDVLKALNKQLGGQPCQGSTERKLPEELDTPEAHELWERAKAMGYVDENLQPMANLTQKEVAIVAFVISGALDLKPKWMALADFWGVTYLSKKYSEAFGKNSSSGDFEREVRRALCVDEKK